MSTNQVNTQDIESKCVNTIRALAMDAVFKANSGHSGTPMALAPIAHVLYTRILKHNPSDPDWYDRDRFILSAGHASMLLYSILHLSGYDVSLEDIKDFRQLGSKTPGHPEYGHTAGVEVTTGPLGQGFAHAVGMAFAEKYLSNRFGKENIDHNIYVLCSDGDLMEGISYEAASIAGHNKLSNLIAIYDDNKITIDGSTDLSFSEDVENRFKAQGWNVIVAGEISEDLDEIEKTIKRAQQNDDAPTLIIVRSHIGFPSEKFINTSAAHGAITDAEDIANSKNLMQLPNEAFNIDSDVKDFYASVNGRCEETYNDWISRNSSNTELNNVISGSDKALIDLSEQDLSKYFDGSEPNAGDEVATRVSCSQILSTISKTNDSLIGGSADLTGNTGTKVSGFESFSSSSAGRQIFFGIREHSMAAIANGMALGYNLRPFVGTFFVFADYMRPSIRLAALTKARVLFVFSHDSIGVGEDGPTHQPIEQLASLRAMPGINVIRPADGYETAAAIEHHLLNSDGPTALVLTRQNIPTLSSSKENARNAMNTGAYEVSNVSNPDVILISSGSEVHLCVEASEKLKDVSINARVISVPCMEKLLDQNETTLNNLFPSGVPVLAVEAASAFGWKTIANDVISMNSFGTSAPAKDVFAHFGITSQNIYETAKKLANK
ncbi:MAG: transketolase [Acidimicrobiia bacterium]